MIRKIAAQALCPGMYVHDLGCSWVDHPFLLNRFVLRTEAEIRKILDAGITEVLIDTERGTDLAAAADGRARPPESRVRSTVSSSPLAHARTPAPTPGAKPRTVRDGPASRAGAVADRAAAPTDMPARTGGTGEPRVVAAACPASMPPPHRRDVPRSAAAGAAGHAVAGHARASPGILGAAGATAPGAEGVVVAAGAAPVGAPLTAETAIPALAPAEAGQAPADVAEPPVAAGVRIANEFKEAKQVHAESCRVVREILNDARLGKQVAVERTRAVVTRMAQSILRNPGPLLALCRIKQKDDYTFQHCVSVGALLMVFGRAAGLDEATTQEAGLGGLLHDIGKMTIPAEMLNKPGMLTEREVAVMHRHVAAGMDMLRATPGTSAIALQVAAEHHERHDGTGYPMGLKGEAISRIGQMSAIVDVYDAITSDRVYHRGLTPAEALKLLFEGSGSHFDPQLVQLLIRTLGIYPTGSLVMLESGRLAIVVQQSAANLLQPRVRVVYDTRKAAFVPPFDVDLARTAGHGGEDRIARHESPQKWSVDPLAYLLREVT